MNPKVTVIMTMYNSEKTLRRAFDSVASQTYPNIEFIMVDDCSTDNTLELAQSLVQEYSHKSGIVREFRILSTSKNYGTYICRNYAIQQSTGEFIGLHDSDDTASRNYIRELYAALVKDKSRKLVFCKTNNRIRKTPSSVICAVSSFFSRRLIENVGYFDSVRFAADSEFRIRCQAIFGSGSVYVVNKTLYRAKTLPTNLTANKKTGFLSAPRKEYVRNFRKFHAQCLAKKKMHLMKYPFPMKKRIFPVHESSLIGKDIDLNSFKEVLCLKKKNEIEAPHETFTTITDDKMIVSANMATIPQRFSVAKKAIDSIINQVDVVRVYLNNFKSIPEFIKNNSKIEYIIGGEDLNASGKHYWSKNPNEYYFTIDDDILYPEHYVRDSLRELNRYNDKAIISCHGRVLPKKTSGYYTDREIEVLHFGKKRSINRLCTVAGTGVSVRNTNEVLIDPSLFKHNHMDDIEVSIQANLQDTPLVIRRGEPLRSLSLPPGVQPIFRKHREQDREQTKIYNSHNWKIHIPDNQNVNKKISVLIAAYKAKDWIQDSVHSILMQELPEGWQLEVIVGIDGCQETFRSVMQLNDDRLGVINFSENSGTYHTFNSIVPFASGSILQRFDADDIMNQGWLHRVISTFELNPDKVVIYGGLLCVSEDLKSTTLPGPASLGFAEYKKKADGIASWRSSYFLDKLGCYKELPCAADTEALIRTKGFGHQPCVLSFCSFFRRVVPTALTHSPKTNHDSDIRKKIKLEIQKDELDYRKKIRTPQKLKSSPKDGEKFGSLFHKHTNNQNYLIVRETFKNFLNNRRMKW